MKTATVRELRNHYTDVFKWIDAGEEVAISKRGVVIARLVPETRKAAGEVDWTTSAALRMDKSKLPLLDEKASATLIKSAGGKW